MPRAILVGMLCAGLVGAAAGMAVSGAMVAGAISTPTPNPPVTCPAEPELDALNETAELRIEGLTARTVQPTFPSRFEDVRLSWTAKDIETGCIGVYRENAGDALSHFGAAPWARLGPRQDEWLHFQINSGGETCYRLVAISGDGRGPPATACLTVAAVATGGATESAFGRMLAVVAVAGVVGPVGYLWWRSRRTP